MLHLFVQSSKYIMLVLILLYTISCFTVFRGIEDADKKQGVYVRQRIDIYLIHLIAFAVLYLTTKETRYIGLYILQAVFLSAVFLMYRLFYKNCSKLTLNNMCMLLTIGFVILTRLSFEKSARQFFFSLAGLFICVLIPVVLSNVSVFRKLTWAYAAIGIAALLTVLVIGSVSYGAKLSVSLFGISIQPSEFVKILYVFFIASMLRESAGLRRLAVTSAVAAVFVLCLVASKDLGSAFLFFVTYLVMVYVATGKFYYFISGLAAMAVAAVAGYHLFSHVRVRVAAWRDPIAVYETHGYQVARSLFGIGTGGWFGLGLNQGMPSKIPVVEKDFVFAAISEELGGAFAVCLLMICLSCFFMFMNIALRLQDPFYKLVSLGLGTIYAMQVVLTIGGTIKFIPSTGVTLPFVSYGGSSLLSTFIIFGIIQGLYMRQSNLMTKKGKKDHEKEGKNSQKENI